MRVLLYAEDFAPMPGGIARYLEGLCEHIAGQVHVVTPVPADRAGERQVPYKTGRFRMPRHLRLLTVSWRLLAAYLRFRPDVCVLGHVTAAERALAFAVLRFLFRCPYVVLAYALDVATTERRVGPVGRLARWVWKKADLVCAISEYTKRQCVAAGVGDERVCILPPGVGDAFLLAPNRRTEARRGWDLGDAFVLLTVSRLVPRKGHVLVLQALPELAVAIPDLVFLVVGDGPYRKELEQISQQLGVTAHVRFAGRVSLDLLVGAYDACDVFIMPTEPTGSEGDVEGFGIVFLEAAARERPAVGSPIGGVTDAVEDGVTGLLAEPTARAIAQAVLELYRDPSRREQMGNKGRQRVLERFKWPAVAEAFADQVEQLRGNPPRWR